MSSTKGSNEAKSRKRQRIEPRKTSDKPTVLPETRKSAKKPSSAVNAEHRKSQEAPESKKTSGKAIDTAESRKSGKSETSESRKSAGKSNESHRKSIKSSESVETDSSKNSNDLPISGTSKPKREVEKIFGITDQRGQLEFSIKFKKEDTVELIPTKIANVEYPQEVIQFYQERLVWKPNGIKC